MRTLRQSNQFKLSLTNMLIALTLIVVFGCSHRLAAQQKDGEGTNNTPTENNAAPGRPTVNFNILTLLNGEYLEMFGAGSSRGILQGNTTIGGAELGTTTAHPLIFSTSGVERMRISPNGFVGIGTTNVINPLDVQFAATNPYSIIGTSPARIRLINNDVTANNVFEIDLGTSDTTGSVSTSVRLAGIFTSHTAGAGSADFAIVLRNAGAFSEIARFASNGRVGFGTGNPQDAFHVFNTSNNVGTIRLQGGNNYAGFIGQWEGSPMMLLTNNRHPGTGNNYTGATGGAQITVGMPSVPGDIGFFTTASGPVGTATELVRIKAGGQVGIGTATPGQKLDVQGGLINASGGLCINGDCKTAWSQVTGSGSQWTTSGTSIFYNGGNVGIGQPSPGAKLHVTGVSPNGTALFHGSVYATHINYNGDNTEDTYIRGGKTTSRVVINDIPGGNVVMVQGGGNVGVGTAGPTSKLHVVGNGRFTGDLTVDGNIAAKYQDVAEWVPAAEQLGAGTVVVLDSTKSNHVISANQPYDTRVAGVISAQPGITLGEKSDNKVLVATTGRVLMNVDATNGPIEIGDLLVTSDREGFAMKSVPVEISGARIHRPGTLIGKALEPLRSGSGKILVLLSLQ